MALNETKEIYDCVTGETSILPLTKEELAYNEKKRKEAAEELKAEAEAKAKQDALLESAYDKLTALGLSKEEISIILKA